MDNIDYLRNVNNNDKEVLYPITNTIRYRNRPFTINHVSYPQPSVDIDYKVSKDSAEEILIQIMDLDNNLINSYKSRVKNENIENYNMSTNEFTFILNSNISNKKGINRFKWDMRHRGSWNKNSRLLYRNGPLVKPGKYKVILTIDGKLFTENFEIISDPRIEDINGEIYDEQERILLEIRDFMTDVRFFENKVSKMLEKKPKNKNLISIDRKLNTKEGTYMQPMLIDQIRYLQSMLSRADQKPGKDAYNRLKKLKSEFNVLKEKLGW